MSLTYMLESIYMYIMLQFSRSWIRLHVVGKVMEGRLATKIMYPFTPPTTGLAQLAVLFLLAAALQ